MPYKVKLNIFEGPMDLLLHLIRKHELDIYDIPIALITKEYLDYLDLMKTLNLDVVGDFLVLAATLTQIKSKMLLPVEESNEETDGVDPRAELVERLLEYKKFKEAAQELKSQENLWIDTYGVGAPTDIKAEQEVVLINLNLLDLMEAFRKVLSRPNADGVHEVTVETMSIKEKISWIMDRLARQRSIRFEDLFPGLPPRQEIIVTFLALLEIIRLRLVRIEQTERFGPIRIQQAVQREDPGGQTAPHAPPEQTRSEES